MKRASLLAAAAILSAVACFGAYGTSLAQTVPASVNQASAQVSTYESLIAGLAQVEAERQAIVQQISVQLASLNTQQEQLPTLPQATVADQQAAAAQATVIAQTMQNMNALAATAQQISVAEANILANIQNSLASLGEQI